MKNTKFITDSRKGKPNKQKELLRFFSIQLNVTKKLERTL